MSSAEMHLSIDLSVALDMTERARFGRHAQERSRIYRLLSRLFLSVPDASHLLQLQSDLASEDNQGPLGELRQVVDRALADPGAAALDFTRRLVIVSRASGEDLPFESFVCEGAIPGVVTEAVVACMGDAGYIDVAPEAPSPDHIGAELKFMALLCEDEGKAWLEGRPAEARPLIGMQRYFLSCHLAAWALDYCEGLEARAEHPYVKAVARMARRCVLAEVATVEDLFIRLNNPERLDIHRRVRGDEGMAGSHKREISDFSAFS